MSVFHAALRDHVVEPGLEARTWLRWHENENHELIEEGLALFDSEPCDAHSVASDRRCPKNAAVLLEVAGGGPVKLCGGHLNVHRKHDLRLADG